MQKFYRALRFYPTCHISYTDLSHDDGTGTIKLRREKTRMTFFSIDKTDGSVEGSTRCVERSPISLSFLATCREEGQIRSPLVQFLLFTRLGERRFRSVSPRLPGN